MSSHFDYEALRAQTMGAGSDEAVTVNTRALIDKVLARYSGEWTILRELLQNAADAAANKVTIRFQTLPSASIPVPQSSDASVRLKHVLQHHTLKSMIIENNGTPFKTADWSRLKKIAEGNPDETKIGAFGVGFYSVFADCEEPFVSSGKEALAFYWRGDSLFTRKLNLRDVHGTNTTFVLPMRSSSSPVPSLLSLCQFLASSLTFVGLESIELWLDDWKILELNKMVAPATNIAIPLEVETKTREGLMQLRSVTREAAQLDARWMKVVEWKPLPAPNTTTSTQGSTSKAALSAPSLRSFFSKLAQNANNIAAEKAAKEERAFQVTVSENMTAESKATIFLHVNKANINTLANQAFSHELERATKKPPPKNTTVSLLTASYDEHTASTISVRDQSLSGMDIFGSVIPTKGRIFIGFPTNQTTGLHAHISTPSVIPTVERESIDLNNRFIRSWNVELLRVAGILARIAWSIEMTDIRLKLSSNMIGAGRKEINKDDIIKLLPEALFLHKSFNFIESTPSSEVGNLMEEAFWTCNKKMSIDVLSSRGVLPSSSVRIATEDLSFVEGIPTLPEPLMEAGLVKRLREYGIIDSINISDIKSELEGKALNVKQLVLFLDWIGKKARSKDFDSVVVQSLFNVAVANDDEEVPPRLLVLSEIKHYLNVARIPAEMPIPHDTMPFKFTKKMNKIDLDALGWEDLQMVPWLRWLVTVGRGLLTPEKDLEKSESFAKAVLPIISKQWDGLSASSKLTVTELLTARTVIPTKMGMKKPTESYFPTVKLFEDLPIILGIPSVKEKFLLALGVRKTIEIGIIFERLMGPSSASQGQGTGKWSHVDLIKYLASIQSDIPPSDIKRLQTTPICLADKMSSELSQQRYLVSDLFEPNDSLRRLQLPIIQWPGIYRSSSPEGRFLSFLGLRIAPSYLELVEIMSGATKEPTLRAHAFQYFIENYHMRGYDSFDHLSVSTPFLPLQDQEKLAKPEDCFSNERAGILGFSILRKDLHPHASKFGVRNDPPIQQCIQRLIKEPPQSRRSARELFQYFAGRLNEIDRQHSDMLGGALIVPVSSKLIGSESKNEKSARLRHISPRLCFFGSDERYAEVFDYVDFGEVANQFLLRCGSKHEPSVSELAALLVQQPAKLFALLEIPRYLELLRNLAESWPILKKNKDLVKSMRKVPFLIAYREHPSQAPKADDEDDRSVRTAELASASQIVIVDDNITFAQFKTSLLTAPLEETLEGFYYDLGTPELGSLVDENHSIGATARNQSVALELQKLLQERSRLYFYDIAPELIKHDAKWIEKSLSVVLVQSISLRKTIKGQAHVHNESRSAAINPSRNGYILSVTPKFDLFEVSQVLVPLLLKRSKTQQIMMLEMILSTDLRKLQSRGYNVQRILRLKAVEERIAAETRKKQRSQEEKEIRDLEAKWNKDNAQKTTKAQQQQSMPGVFPDSPDHNSNHPNRFPPPEEDQEAQKPRGFFSDIGKRLGLENTTHPMLPNRSSEGLTNGRVKTPQEDLPPPYSQEDVQKSSSPVPQPEVVTAPHRLQQNLVKAIHASRAYNSSTVISDPTVNEVKETHSYCDAKPGQNITYIGEIASMRIFLSNTVTSTLGTSPQRFLAANASALNAFAEVLLDCAAIFGARRESLHVFYDEKGSTIAFNQTKALFFNYRYFENLHLPSVQQGNSADAVVYWSVVMAHELAHNLVADHSANHSYYTEALVVQYFTKIVSKINPLSNSKSDPSRPQRSLLDID